jgi:preprotein translocase subunit SecB
MKKETAGLIHEAAMALSLKDIILYESHLFRDAVLPRGELDAQQQHKRGVRFGVSEEDVESDKELQIVVSLGTRVVQPTNGADSDEVTIFFAIEADFMVIYTLERDIGEKEISTFAEHNAIHNVWPFWRQHVFDTMAKARLPQLDIPLFSGNGP